MPPHTATVERESKCPPIKWMPPPHTSYRWRGFIVCQSSGMRSPPHQLQVERERGESLAHANQVYALTPPPSYRWRGERVIEAIQVDAASPHHQLTRGDARESHRGQSSGLRLTTHQLQVERERVIGVNQRVCAPTTTSYTWRRRRES